MKRLPWVLLLLGAGLVGATAGGLVTLPPGSYGYLARPDIVRYVAWAGLAGAVYAAGVWLVRRGPVPRGAVPVILAAGLAARLVVVGAPPVLSTDLYRYIWDGKVQAAGVNPYRFRPSDPALAPLRDPGHVATSIYLNVNRAETAHTIYPPAAQMVFALVGLAAPSIWTVKGVMLGFDLVTTGLVLLLLRAARRPDAFVLIWAWNPLVISEFAGAGHVDAMAVALMAGAMLLAVRARMGWAGFALTLAVLTKVLPAALFPAIWRRWDWRMPLIAACTGVAFYAVYASVGWQVFGYLLGYTQEERLQDGGGFLLLRLLALAGPVPAWAGAAYAVAGLVLLAATALAVVRRPLPPAPAPRTLAIAGGSLALASALLAVMSPHYPWYLTMLVLPAAVVPFWAALWPTVAGPLLYLDPSHNDVLWPALVFLPVPPILLLDLRRNTTVRAPARLAEVEGGP